MTHDASRKNRCTLNEKEFNTQQTELPHTKILSLQPSSVLKKFASIVGVCEFSSRRVDNEPSQPDKLEAIQRWSAMSRVTLNFDLSKIPFVHF